MIKFDQLIKVIHDAALSANQALADENLKIIDKYFEKTNVSESHESLFDEALQSVNTILKKKDSGKNEIKAAVQNLIAIRNASINNNQDGESANAESLKPKIVVLQYPIPTQDGFVMKDVEIPLISLIPVSMSEVSEIKFKTTLELIVDDDNLQVGFPNKSDKNKLENTSPNESHYSTLEITIRPREGSEGLTTLIQGYEKALRAQLP